MRKHLFTTLALLVSTAAGAQDSLKVTTLREVVVSARRGEQILIEVPRSVSVIDAEVLRRTVHQSLGDLLNSQAGLYVVGASQTPGANQNLFMRGASSNQVAILVDGVRITDPSTPNAAMDLSEISLANVERIEVIRGSHSTMFGNAAIGGVVNLITKKDSRSGLHGDASWQGAVFGKNTWSSSEMVNLNYAPATGLYVTGSLFQQDVKGLDATDKSSTRPSFTSDRDDFQKTDGSVKAGFANKEWDAYLSFKKTHQFTEIDNGAYVDDDNNYLKFDRNLLQYYASYKLDPSLKLSALGSFTDSERFFENDSSKINAAVYDRTYSTGTYYGKLQTHEAQIDYAGAKVKAMLGAGLYREEMFFDSYFLYNDPLYPFELTTNYDTLDTRARTAYIFTQLAYEPGAFHVSGGVRLSHHSTAGSFLTYEINPSLTFKSLLLYASLSTGFNAPSLYQLYDPSRSFSAYTTRGNADLGPERSTSLEVGIKNEFSRGSYVTFSAYSTQVREAIEYVLLWDGGTPVGQLDYTHDRGDTYINVGKQIARGVEAEGFAQITSNLHLQASIALIKTRIEVDPGNIDLQHTGGNHVQLYNPGVFITGALEQNDLIRRPDMSAFARIGYRLSERLAVGASWRYTGKRIDAGYDETLGPYGALGRLEVQAYHLVDVDLNVRATKIFNIGLKFENILDEDYREVVGFRTKGRSAFLKLSARW